MQRLKEYKFRLYTIEERENFFGKSFGVCP
nr:helix-turn-helix domain-containing protein [Staphylococcus kloosii]